MPGILPMALLLLFCTAAGAQDFSLHLRTAALPAESRIVDETWKPSETAVIVCDTWDLHHSVNAVKRIEEFAPRMDSLLKEARKRGATIIHAPSDCMPAYEGHPARQRAINAPRAANLPRNIEYWCPKMRDENGALYPLDQSADVEDDDPAEHAAWVERLKGMGRNPGNPWKTESPLIGIDEERDYISDKGDEVWNILEARGVKNVLMMGVHANMCVLGRPFGLRNLVQNGKHAVLIRDLTDCMYNPENWPYVDHFTGNDLLVQYIERTVCPTITSDQILDGMAFRFAADKRAPAGLPVLPERVGNTWRCCLDTHGRATMQQSRSEFSGDTTPIWTRCQFWISGNFIAKELVAPVAKKEDMKVRAWINGRELPLKDSAEIRRWEIPEGVVLPHDPNWLVFQLEGPHQVLASVSPSLSDGSVLHALSGSWQLLLTPEDLSQIPMPAKFGGSPDMCIEVSD